MSNKCCDKETVEVIGAICAVLLVLVTLGIGIASIVVALQRDKVAVLPNYRVVNSTHLQLQKPDGSYGESFNFAQNILAALKLESDRICLEGRCTSILTGRQGTPGTPGRNGTDGVDGERGQRSTW